MREIGGHGSGPRPPAPGMPRPGAHGPNGTNGHRRPVGPGRPYDTLATERFDDEGPIDLVELQADDELINALSSGLGVSGPGQQGYDADDKLVAMLASWRADVESEPFPELVEPDVAVEMMAPTPRTSRTSRRVSYLRPVVAAVAVAACGLGVLSVTAHEAQPGDSLWGLSKVLYSERAEQVQAATDLRTGIERVNAKLASGDTAGAQQELAAMAPLLTKVEPGQEQAYFDQQNQFLAAKVAETPPGVPTDPAAPLRNGTQAPKPPVSEGEVDEPAAPVQGDPQAPTVPGPAEGSGGPGPAPAPASEGTPPAAGPVEPSPVEPTTSPEPVPTTEGSADPTTTPTASGPTGSPTPTTSTTG